MRRVAIAMLLSLLVSCADSDDATRKREGEHTKTLTFTNFWAPGSQVVLLVVDDAPGASFFRSDLWTALSRSATPRGGYDPSYWRALDWTVIVARPRAIGSARWIGPANDPRLRLMTDQIVDDDREALMAAIEDAASSRPTDGPFRALEAARDGMALLLGERAPEDAREQELLSALPELTGVPSFVHVVVAALQPDESPGEVEAYAPPHRTSPPYLTTDAVYPEATSDCSTLGEASGRIAAWGQAHAPFFGVQYPCGREQMIYSGLLSMGHVDGGFPYRFCASRPVLRDETGRAACRVDIKVREPNAECDPTRGWRDAATPHGEDEWGPFRRCELRPVPDAERERCASDDECDGCSSGFCASERELDRSACAQAGMYPTLRFVGGAISSVDATLEAQCLLVD